MRHSRRLTPLLFLLVIALLASTPALAAIDRSFEVDAGGKLRLDTDVGSVEVRTHDRDVVEVAVDVSGVNAEDFDVDFDHRGADVTVRGDYRGRRLFSWGRSPRVEFQITVPRSYHLDLDTSGGSIEVSDLAGTIKAETSGGSLRFGDIAGPVRASTSGGNVVVGRVDGRVEVDTSGGSIEIDRVAGEVYADTSGGNIRVEEVAGAIEASTSGGSVYAYISKQPQGRCRLTTSGGSITVELAEGIGVDLDARSSGGRVRSDFPVDGLLKREYARGEIGGGGPELYLSTSGGGIRIHRR